MGHGLGGQAAAIDIFDVFGDDQKHHRQPEKKKKRTGHAIR